MLTHYESGVDAESGQTTPVEGSQRRSERSDFRSRRPLDYLVQPKRGFTGIVPQVGEENPVPLLVPLCSAFLCFFCATVCDVDNLLIHYEVVIPHCAMWCKEVLDPENGDLKSADLTLRSWGFDPLPAPANLLIPRIV